MKPSATGRQQLVSFFAHFCPAPPPPLLLFRLVPMELALAAEAIAANGGIDVEIPHLIRTYKCGRIKRLQPAKFVPPSVDPRTGVTSKDVPINPELGLSARLYRPPSAALPPSAVHRKLPVVVYYHGGGFCTGSPFSSVYHAYLNSLAAEAGVLAVSVDYRLAPEHPLPAAYHDSWAALRWVVGASSEPWLAEAADLDSIYLAGDSAGANIAHDVAMRLGKEGMKVEGLALLHPFFWGRERIGREGDDGEGAMFRAKNADELWPLVCPGTKLGLDDPRLNPLALGGPGLSRLGCRRVMVSVAGKDLLRERGKAYYENLVESGWEGEAEFFESEGKDHVFHLSQRRSSLAVELMRRVVDFLGFRRKEVDDDAVLGYLGSRRPLLLTVNNIQMGGNKLLSRL